MPQAPLGDIVRLYTTIAFTPNLPAGFVQCEDQCVTGPLAFSQPLDPAGTGAMMFLVANGVNEPTFGDMSQAAGSSAWNNQAGAINGLEIVYKPLFSSLQQYSFSETIFGSTIVPCVSGISCVHGLNPTIVIATGGSALNTAAVPGVDRFSVQRSPSAPNQVTPGPSALPVTAVAVTSDSITLTLAGTVYAGDNVTLSYAPLQPGVAPYPISVQDANANLLRAITNAAVTVS